MSSLSRTPVRAVGLVGGAWGVVLLWRGRELWTTFSGTGPTGHEVLAIRALGWRHLVQGCFQSVAPDTGRQVLVAVDLVHCATMVPVAIASRRARRPAAVTSAVAAASAVVTAIAARGGGTASR